MPKHMISKKGTVSVKNNTLKHGKGIMLKLERHAEHAYDRHPSSHERRELKDSLANLTLNSSHKRYVKF